MAENEVCTEVNTDEGGKIIFATEVIATIAGMAAQEVEGVDTLSGNMVEGISVMLGGKKSHTKGIKVEVNGDVAVLGVSVVVKYGYKIHEVCMQIQQAVKNAVETMTGLSVSGVTVAVQAISFEKADTVIRESKRDKEKDKDKND